MNEIIIAGIILYIVYVIFFGRDKGMDAYQKKTTPTMKFIGAAAHNTYRNADCNAIDIGGMYLCMLMGKETYDEKLFLWIILLGWSS